MAKKTKSKTSDKKKLSKNKQFALICGFCGRKNFKSARGLASHKRHCKEAPEPADNSNMGRPTEYSPELIIRVHKYLESCKDEWYPQIQSYKEPEEGEGRMEKLSVKQQLKVKIPSIKGLMIFLKVPESTLYDWAKLYPDFSEALSFVLAEQHERLLNQGLAGVYNPTLAKLGLTSNHGYSDKKGIEAKVGLSIEQLLDTPFDENEDEEV